MWLHQQHSISDYIWFAKVTIVERLPKQVRLKKGSFYLGYLAGKGHQPTFRPPANQPTFMVGSGLITILVWFQAKPAREEALGRRLVWWWYGIVPFALQSFGSSMMLVCCCLLILWVYSLCQTVVGIAAMIITSFTGKFRPKRRPKKKKKSPGSPTHKSACSTSRPFFYRFFGGSSPINSRKTLFFLKKK